MATATNVAFGTAIPGFYSAFKNAGLAVAVVDVAGTGAPTLMAWTPVATGASNAGTYVAAPTTGQAIGPGPGSQNIATISRTSTGLYVLTMQASYQRLLGFFVTFSVPSTVNSGKTLVAQTNELTPAGGIDAPGGFIVLTFQCLDFAGNVVDPGSGEQMRISLVIDNSGTI